MKGPVNEFLLITEGIGKDKKTHVYQRGSLISPNTDITVSFGNLEIATLEKKEHEGMKGGWAISHPCKD